MATYRDLDSLETAVSRVGGAVSDVLDRAAPFDVTKGTQQYEDVMRAAQALTDELRLLRRRAEGVVLEERGARR